MIVNRKYKVKKIWRNLNKIEIELKRAHGNIQNINANKVVKNRATFN